MSIVENKAVIIILFMAAVLLVLLLSQIIYIKVVGSPVPAPPVAREAQTVGNSSTAPLRYAVLGDSTTIAQGGSYREGYAYKGAEHLAAHYAVILQHFGVSGARAQDVAEKQVPHAAAFRPDMAVIGVGANDVTHLTDTKVFGKYLEQTIIALRDANPAVQIVVTGSPDMGSVPRLPYPVRWLAGSRTKTINAVVSSVAKQQDVIFAPIADRTGPIFRKHPELFAADKFHPNAAGYRVWIPVINEALDTALRADAAVPAAKP